MKKINWNKTLGGLFTTQNLTIALATIGVLLAAAWVFFLRYSVPWPARTGAALIVIGIGVSWLRLRLQPPELESKIFMMQYRTSNIVRALLTEAAEITGRYDKSVLALLADMIVEPETYRDRVTENLELGRWVTKRKVSMDICIGDRQFAEIEKLDQSKAALLIPLIEPQKGWLFDRLSIHCPGNREVVSLSYGSQSMALYVAVLIHQFYAAYPKDLWDSYPNQPKEPRRWPKDKRHLLMDLVMIVAKSAAALKGWEEGSGSDLDQQSRNRMAVAVRQAHGAEIDERIGPAEQFPEVDKLRRIAKIGIAHYLVIMRCQPSRHLRLEYSYEQSTGSFRRGPMPQETAMPTRILQKLLGLPSGFLKIGLVRATHAKSYHMHVAVPEGSYLRLAHVTDEYNRAVVVNSRPSIAVDIPYLRPVMKSVTGVHLYGRHLSGVRASNGTFVSYVPRLGPTPEAGDPKPVHLGLRARVCERPSGTELFATLIAWSLLLVTVILLEACRRGADTDVAVAVLALPAAIGALAVFFVRAFDRSLLVSLAGAGLTMVTALLAVIVMCVFGYEATISGMGRSGARAAWEPWSLYWQILVALIAIVVIITTGMLIIRTRRYFSTRFRPDPVRDQPQSESQ